jgi:hypothetical protein
VLTTTAEVVLGVADEVVVPGPLVHPVGEPADRYQFAGGSPRHVPTVTEVP